MDKLDLFVIGAGSAGVRAARTAAGFGAKVGICEVGRLGGTCVNVGCIPKKLMVFGAHFADEWRDAAGYGWKVAPPEHDWATLIRNKDREIARLNTVYGALLEGKGVQIFRGRGVLKAPGVVEVTGGDGVTTRIEARNVLVCTGGYPARLQVPGAEHVMVSDDVFALERLPRRIVVIGGGYIAVELAGVFAGLGAEVTLVARGALLLRGFDHDVRAHLASEMRAHGIDLRLDCDLARVEKLASGALAVQLENGARIETDAVLGAVGRLPNSSGLGLEELGVRRDARGGVLVDARFRTSVPGVYAVGDVIDRIQLTPVALAEGMIVARNLFAGGDFTADYDLVPSAVFSNPPIGTVGLTEEEAVDAYGEVDVYKSIFTPLKLTITERKEKTLMKLVVDSRSQRVVGVHMVGADAGEIVQGFAVALRCGATKADFDRTIGIHPTAAEELVTMREKVSAPESGKEVRHRERPKVRQFVPHRWDDKENV